MGELFFIIAVIAAIAQAVAQARAQSAAARLLMSQPPPARPMPPSAAPGQPGFPTAPPGAYPGPGAVPPQPGMGVPGQARYPGQMPPAQPAAQAPSPWQPAASWDRQPGYGVPPWPGQTPQAAPQPGAPSFGNPGGTAPGRQTQPAPYQRPSHPRSLPRTLERQPQVGGPIDRTATTESFAATEAALQAPEETSPVAAAAASASAENPLGSLFKQPNSLLTAFVLHEVLAPPRSARRP